jgi:putative Mg2+ transporter-C (MgtC) family protein
MFDFINIAPLKVEACIIAMLCGFAIGFERQWLGKPAGIRTSILVCLGAYSFIAVASYLQPGAGAVRVVGQMVTGVGFLGAGMMLSKEGSVVGVTSAATIWLMAAIGTLIGFEYYNAAFFLTGMTLFALVGISILEKSFKKLRRGVHKLTFNDQDKEG